MRVGKCTNFIKAVEKNLSRQNENIFLFRDKKKKFLICGKSTGICCIVGLAQKRFNNNN